MVEMGGRCRLGVNVTSKLLPKVMLRTSVTFGAEKFTNFFLLNNTLLFHCFRVKFIFSFSCLRIVL